MKKRILPFGLVSLIFLGIAAFFLMTAHTEEKGITHDVQGGQSIIKAKEYLAMIRNNQHTGLLNSKDVIKARNQIAANSSFKSGSENDLEWMELGPDNIGGRVRAIIFDNRDETSNTVYVASVTGGIFKSTNYGNHWSKVNSNGSANLNISCMAQASDGTIYVGTGEGFSTQKYSGFGEIGYASGFVGRGLFKSDENDIFTLVGGTQPTANNDTVDWAYINEIAIGSDNKIWLATNTGLLVGNEDDWSFAKYIDSTGTKHDLIGLAWDVQIDPEGTVYAAVEGKGYVTSNDNAEEFITFSTGAEDMLPAEDVGRIEFAIAPSDANIVYAMAAYFEYANVDNEANNSLQNIYLSENKGESWRVVAPGNSDFLNILGSSYFDDDGEEQHYYQGDYNSTLAVFPNDPYRILAGGVNLWEGKRLSETSYYQWEKKSVEDPLFGSFYVHADHHKYVFRPGSNNEFLIVSDGGVYSGLVSGTGIGYNPRNKLLNITQYYGVDASNKTKEFLGGTQDNGTLLVNGESVTPMKATQLWDGDGGHCEVSSIRVEIDGEDVTPPAIFYSKSPLPDGNGIESRIRRSESLGFDYSVNLFDSVEMSGTAFLTPILFWESFNDLNNPVHVPWIADTNYAAGEIILARSINYNHPFQSELLVDVNKGDTVYVQDVISNRLFIALDESVWMTMDGLLFGKAPIWFLISNSAHSGVEGIPQCIAYSADANYLWVGTQEGRLFRISNLRNAYDYELADVTSPNCIVATDEVFFTTEENSQVVTSISVDPMDANKVLISLGNYGNDNYVFYSENGTGDIPTFSSAQGNLPQMPIYSAILEMDENSDIAILGTEEGIWMTDDITSAEWYSSSSYMNKVPVMTLKQQTITKPSFTLKLEDPGTGEIFYESYPEIENYGWIYAATYGRGIFADNTFASVGINDNDHPATNSGKNQELSIYPNPANDIINIRSGKLSSENAIVNIYDLSGKLVKAFSVPHLNNEDREFSLNVNTLIEGTYLVQLVAGDDNRTAKLMIVK